jgi:hypothetical protein
LLRNMAPELVHWPRQRNRIGACMAAPAGWRPTPEAFRCRSPVVRPVLPWARPRPIAGRRSSTRRPPIRGTTHCYAPADVAVEMLRRMRISVSCKIASAGRPGCCDWRSTAAASTIGARPADDVGPHAQAQCAVARGVAKAVPPPFEARCRGLSGRRIGAGLRPAHGAHPPRYHRRRRAAEAPAGARCTVPLAPPDPGAPLPRFPSLAAFGRRPRCLSRCPHWGRHPKPFTEAAVQVARPARPQYSR